jgi:hypothetical protein
MSKLKRVLFTGLIIALIVPMTAFSVLPNYYHYGHADLAIDGNSLVFTGYYAKAKFAYVQFCDGSFYFHHVYAWAPETWDFGKSIAFAGLLVEVQKGRRWHQEFLSAYGNCWSAKEVIPSMLLYTSDAGFYTTDAGRVVNTCSIISEGPASVDRIKVLCKSVPEDINLTCGGPVWQMTAGDTRGFWECDAAQQDYQEGRLDLFGPEGGLVKGTLYWVYQEHLKHLAGD